MSSPIERLVASATLAFALGPTSAFAHAQLEKASPPAGGTVPPPSQIRLEFSEGVEPKFSSVTVTGSVGPAALGATSVESGHQNVLIVPIAKPLSPGAYTVKWRAMSVDTHHTQWTYEFTVK
jgi:copper resistance protein C